MSASEVLVTARTAAPSVARDEPAELRRVKTEPVVILACNPAADRFWLNEYVPGRSWRKLDGPTRAETLPDNLVLGHFGFQR